MSEESQESLAAQMGAWVPPWERRRDEPDREFQEEAGEASADDSASDSDQVSTDVVYDVSVVPEIVEKPDEEPVEEPVEPVAEEPVRSDAEAEGYLAGFQDAAERLAPVAEVTAEPVVDVTPTPVAVPVQATGPRGGEDEERIWDDAELAAALEAILLVVDEPTNELKLAEVLEQPVERVARTLDNLSARYTAAGHGFDLRRAAGGWRLYTRPEYATYVERFVLDGQSVRLTQAALETLAVVAYKQPVTRSRISAIRGVNCDGVMRTLVTRGLIEEVGTEPETGAYLYRTTALFLEKLGLNSVDQLPPLAPFLPDDVEEVLDASG